MLEIDGSYGEGGGQILRTALSLSCLTGSPFRISNIRQGRHRPGLMPQHLAAVRAAQAITGAALQGAEPGSTTLDFTPHALRGGEYSFDIGTAGSVTLVLQTLVLPLLQADRPSRVTLTGGTHVPASPSFHYLQQVFAPMLHRLGGRLRVSIHAYGFYPRGGGRICAEILPARELQPLSIGTSEGLHRILGSSGVCNLPQGIAERQRTAALAMLDDTLGDSRVTAEIDCLSAQGSGQGTFLFLRADSADLRAGFTALGARGKRAEAVGTEAAEELCRHQSSGAELDPHLADQLVPYLALCRRESTFTTSCITSHLLSNLWVVGCFMPMRFTVEGDEGQAGRVSIYPL
jgi:RNA 3'-terminal phosphate cyclase (ATP)